MWGIPEVQGVSEVNPYTQIGNLVAWRRWAAKTAASTSSGSKMDRKNASNNQPVGSDVRGVRITSGSGGNESDPSRPPSRVDQAAAPDGFRRPKHPPGSKFQPKRALTTINRSKWTRGSHRRAPGGV